MVAHRPKPPPLNPRGSDANKPARRCLGVAVCLALLTGPAATAHKGNRVTAVRMEDDPEFHMVWVYCRIKGAPRRYVCVIDSGATMTIISDRILQAEGPAVRITTGNGEVRANQREVSLIIAEVLEVRSKASVQPKMPEGVDILVGQDVLRQFRSVIFNYETREVEFQR